MSINISGDTLIKENTEVRFSDMNIEQIFDLNLLILKR